MNKFTLDKDQAVLMVIDIQERLVPAMKVADQVINNTNVLISAAKAFDIPIVTTEQYPKGLGSTIPEIKDQVNPMYLFEKTSFTAYITEVKMLLEILGRKKIIITGMETHVCVFQTIRDLLGNDYQVFIAADAVCSRTKENHLSGLGLIKDMGAVLTNTESIIFDLLKTAQAPQFKTLSKLIK